MGYWKSKVLPTINKVFKKDNTAKKAAAAEASKSFDDNKEEINKEFEEKKTELQPKVLEIYEASSVELKALIKDPKDAGLKKHSALVQKFIDELAKIDFPGSKPAAEASSKFGPSYVTGPVLFIFEKVSTFIVVEEKAKELPAETSSKEKEVVVEEEKKEEVVAVEAEKTTEPPPAAVEEEAAAASEPPAKVEETAAETKAEEAAEPPKP